MSGVNELFREGIIAKLREYDAYIDNELPDYIMVMLANNKTTMQINQDLQLFLGDNTEKFTTWLQEAISNPDILRIKESSAAEPNSVTSRKRKKSRTEDPPPERPHPQDYDSEEEYKPPAVKVSKMRSDRHEEEKPVRTRSERPSIRRYDVQSARANAKKTVRAQPDSTRDRDRDGDGDLRELIAGRQHFSGGRGTQHGQRSAAERDRGRKRRSEGEEGEVEEGEEVEVAVPTTTVSSVVKLVERPRHTDVGGSRLLRRAILGLAPSSKRSKTVPISVEGGVVRRSSEGEKVIILPASVLSDGGLKKIVLTKKQSQIAGDVESPSQEGEEGVGEEGEVVIEEDDDDDDDDEVIVNVDGEGQDFDDEYRVEGMTEAEISAVTGIKRSKGSKITVLTSSSHTGHHGGRGEEGEESVDLRDIINKSREGKMERISPRFVVTLSGAPNMAQAGSTERQAITAITAPVTTARGTPSDLATHKSIKDRLGAKVQEMESVEEVTKEEEEEESGGTGLLERCRFWPNCKNGDSCPYHHPTVPCKLFPDCKYGKKCLYVHPQCKYNSRCTRIDCPYLHTAPRHLAVKTQVVPQMIPTPIPVPQIYRPPFSPYSYSSRGPSPRGPSPRLRPRLPNKSAFSWKPASHISERKFAVPDEQTTNLSS